LETVYLSRHGETEWNVSRRRQGQSDSPLTPDGIDQARAIAMIASHLPIDRIFTSPLGRATATAVIAGHATGVPLEIVDDLAEVDHGQFAGLTNDEIEARHPGVLAERAGQKYTWRFPMGESYHDADTRAGRALEYMHAAGSRRPLLVTHEMVGLMVLRRLLDLTPEAALARSLPHGQVLEVVPSRTSVRVVRAR
jgi:probable phosphoglycerate mutase